MNTIDIIIESLNKELLKKKIWVYKETLKTLDGESLNVNYSIQPTKTTSKFILDVEKVLVKITEVIYEKIGEGDNMLEVVFIYFQLVDFVKEQKDINGVVRISDKSELEFKK